MPRIEPIPLPEIDNDIRIAIDEGPASGMYTQTLPLQIMAHDALDILSDREPIIQQDETPVSKAG